MREKGNRVIIGMLITIIVILFVLIILLGTETISFKSNKTNNNSVNSGQTMEDNYFNDNEVGVNEVRYYKYKTEDTATKFKKVEEIQLNIDGSVKYYSFYSSSPSNITKLEGKYIENDSAIVLMFNDNRVIVLKKLQNKLVDIYPYNSRESFILDDNEDKRTYKYDKNTFHASLLLNDENKATYSFAKENSGGATCDGTYIETDDIIIFKFDYQCYTLSEEPLFFMKVGNNLEYNPILNGNNSEIEFNMISKSELELIK